MDLSGKLLIAMPGMGDPRFEKAVVFVCAHSSDGAMGLIINKPAPDLEFRDLLKQLEIEGDVTSPDTRIHFGGPVEGARGFVLHSADYPALDATLSVDSHFSMTATQEILRDMARGKGPKEAILVLGYSGWGPGQLEAELSANGWLTCDASQDLVFAPDDSAKWKEALKSLGVDALTLSASAGRA